MSRVEQIRLLLMRWKQLRDQGQQISAEDLCRECPELLDEVRQQLMTLQLMEGWLGKKGDSGGTVPPPFNSTASNLPPPPPQAAKSFAPSPPPHLLDEQSTLSSERMRPPPDLPVIPGYNILGEIARGGMGIVYQARHIQLNRIVALKMILTAGSDETELSRFRDEAKTIARLQHPNIVQIFEVGTIESGIHKGKPWLSLEFCEGGSLDKRLAGTPLPVREAAELIQTLAQAVHAAHRRQILHRDLKPANVLLTGDDHPKITDFGLAKQLDQETDRTRKGAIMGTPSYMAPEQASGKTKDVSAEADVYALGVILYECLTGRPPFKAATTSDTLLQVIYSEPVSPRQLQPKVSKDLETICLKCLAKEPSKRYATAADLAEDLRRFLADEPIKARSTGFFEKSVKWFKRRPAAAFMTVVAVLIALAGAAGVAWTFGLVLQERNAVLKERNKARAEKIRAEKGEKEANRLKQIAQARAADLEKEQKRTKEALATAEKEKIAKELQLEKARRNLFAAQIRRVENTYQQDPFFALSLLHDYDSCPIDLRDFTWQFLNNACRRWQKPTLLKSSAKVTAAAFSRKGKTLAMGTDDGRILLWNLKSKKVQRTLNAKAPVHSLQFSGDGKYLASAAKEAAIWELASGNKTWHYHNVGDIDAIALSLDGTMLAFGSKFEGVVRVVDNTNKLEIHNFPLQFSRKLSLAFSPAGNVLAVGGGPRTGSSINLLTVYDYTFGKPREIKLQESEEGVGPLAFTADGKTLASGSDDRILLWNWSQSKRKSILEEHSGEVIDISVDPSGEILASVDAAGILRLWNLITGEKMLLLDGDFRLAAIDGQGEWLATDAKTPVSGVQLWNLAAAQEQSTQQMAIPSFDFGVISADRKRFAVKLAGEFRFAIGTIEKGVQFPIQEETKVAPSTISAAAISPDGKVLVSGTALWNGVTEVFDKGEISPWDLKNGKYLDVGKKYPGAVTDIACSPNGKLMAVAYNQPKAKSASYSGHLKLWTLSPIKELTTLGEARPLLLTIAFSWDSRILAVADAERITLWDVVNRKEMSSLETRATVLAFSRDDRLLASARGSDIKLWDLKTGMRVHTFRGSSSDFVVSMDFSPDGSMLASANRKGGMKLWDVQTGQERATFRSDKHSSEYIAFSEDGKQLITFDKVSTPSGYSGEMNFWHAAPHDEYAFFDQHDGAVTAVQFTADGKRLASAGEDQKIYLWDTLTGQERVSFLASSPVRNLALSPDGKWLAWAEDKTIKLRQLETGKIESVFQGHTKAVKLLTFSPQSDLLISAAGEKTLRVWRLATGKSNVVSGHKQDITAAAFHPDGTMLVAGDDEGALMIVDVAAGKFVTPLKAHAKSVTALAFDKGGKTLVSAGKDEIILVWDFAATKVRYLLKDQPDEVTALAVASDGKTFASAYPDGTVKLWDLSSGKLRRTINPHVGPITAIDFSPDGKLLATASEDETVKLWDLGSSH